MRAHLGAIVAATALALLPAAPAIAARVVAAPAVSGEAVAQIQQAIDEQRLVDAARMLDAALLAGGRDPRLAVARGDLNMARANYEPALASYKAAQDTPATRAAALQGQGIALALMGRSGEAMAVLQSAVVEFPAAWRAWNALGSEYDHRGRWAEAEDAYAHALSVAPGEALVLNNRGYSRLLQHRRTDAVADLVAALQKRPAFPEAQTNLRLALAMRGDYDRAIAGGTPDDQATLLNNAGFAAGMRGDYAQAEDLLGRAITAKSVYYARATENLKIVRALAAQRGGPADAPR
ncbi:MAG TPA: tetratricopeptide repeat protein [Phenylobacterium sp.]|jgi:Flp pilus assembly protein TadD|nr:tetratricopeptide repeat protein [Phenylobacterium sp.]